MRIARLGYEREPTSVRATATITWEDAEDVITLAGLRAK
jgi:hypothetical protein